MSAASPMQPIISAEQYLAAEREADTRSEYFGGEVVAMAGASYRHNIIVSNLVRELGSRMRVMPCRAVASDMRVAAGASFTYPDVVVHCGEPEFTDDRRDTLVNPVLLIEVLSPTTEVKDRGEKFAYFRLLDSLQEYVLVSQDRVLVERYTRQGRLWLLDESRSLNDNLMLESCGCRLSISDIYDGISLPAPAGPDTTGGSS